jgi:hypothetical protein
MAARKNPNPRIKAPKLKINVSTEMIEVAVRADSRHCMIAQAVADAYPNARYIAIDLASIRFSDREKGFRYQYFTPAIAQRALLEFDKGELPTPFSCVLIRGHSSKLQSYKGLGLTPSNKRLDKARTMLPVSHRRQFGLRALAR